MRNVPHNVAQFISIFYKKKIDFFLTYAIMILVIITIIDIIREVKR